MSRDLAAAVELDAIAEAVVTHVRHTFGYNVTVLLPRDRKLAVSSQSPGFVLTDDDRAAAQWSFENNQPAGRETNTVPNANAQHLPLTTAQTTIGVLGVQRPTDGPRLTPEQRRLLETFASHAALATERVQLAEKASQAQLLRAKEQLQTALLNSISHDLRTPLASITGALSSLRDDSGFLTEAAQHDLIETAWEESKRLNRLVGNLLDMPRLESGAMKVAQEPCDVQDVVGVALSRLADRLRHRPVTVDVAEEIPLVPMDFVLIVQVLVNLIDNALKYSPAGSPIDVRAQAADTDAEITVADRGYGLSDDQVERVFDKFYRLQRANGAGGTGLGLSISKGIVEAHGGRIWATNRPEGGAVITFTLPLTQQNVDAGEGTRL